MNSNIKSLIGYIRYKVVNCDMKYINYILYYSDFKNLLKWYTTLTNSSYHFINNMPYCSALLGEIKPVDTFHLKQYNTDGISKNAMGIIDEVIEEYHMIKAKFGEDGLDNFVKNICNISGRPTINGQQMLIYITQEWDRKERRAALDYYNEQEAVRRTITDSEGHQIECTKYI